MIIKKINFLVGIFLFLGWSSLRGQDIHFSNYESSLPILNPSLVGLIPDDNDLRLTTVYRNQWASALESTSFKTYGVVFDMRNCLVRDGVKHANTSRTRFQSSTWGLGLSFIHDESGTMSVKDLTSLDRFPLSRNQISLSSSIHKTIGNGMFINGGFRVGGVFHNIPTNHLTYDEQFNGIAGFDPMVTGEFDNRNDLQSDIIDFGAGISFIFLEKDYGITVGGSVDHILDPSEYTFLESDDPPLLIRKFVVHGKVSYAFDDEDKKSYGGNIKGLFQHQNSFQQLMFGYDFFYQDKYGDNKNYTLTLGGSIRLSRRPEGRNIDAAVAKVSINFENYSFGFNYDINTSRLNYVTNSFGALEVSMRYMLKKKNSGCRMDEVGCNQNVTHAIFF